MCLCVCIDFCVNVFWRVTKILKKHQYRMESYQSNGTILVFFSLTLISIFEVKVLAFYLICECLVHGEGVKTLLSNTAENLSILNLLARLVLSIISLNTAPPSPLLLKYLIVHTTEPLLSSEIIYQNL